MSKQGKIDNAPKQTREAMEASEGQKTMTLTGARARSWAAVQKLPGGGKKMEARRQVPSGPLGGSGRKTNVSRSS